MPSVDQIRTITIKGKADGVDDATAALDRLTASIQSANDNLAKSNAAANDNSSGFRLTGESAATAANHLRQAAEAAYAFSPAFRGVVNEMAVPALGAANTALAAVAAGIVTATNYAGTGLITLAGAAEKASPSLLAYTSSVRATGIAMEAFSPTVGSAAGSLLSFLSPALKVLGWFALAVDGIKLVGEAWELGGQKLADYVALNDKAVASGVSTDFFQRITKAAADAKQPVDLLTAAFKNLADATADKLGGSTGANRIDELMNSKNFNGATGNFAGNTGVTELANANTTQEKFKAISDLIDQAMQKGERLAALDVAKTFLGDAVAANLARDSDYLNKMIASADKIKAGDLVSQESIDNAVSLQNRLDAAEKILSERWHPVQDLLVAGGIAMREAWVNIVENIAAAFDWATKLMAKLGDVPPWFVQQLNNGATAFMNATTTPESRAAAEAQYGITSNPAEMAMLAARQKLAGGMQNPANIASATDQINTIQNKVFPDVSKDPGKTVDGTTGAYDRAQGTIEKYIETTKAAALAVSDAAGEQEKFKVIAELTAAGIKDRLTPEAAKAKAELSGLGEKAGLAADALAKAKMASSIDFGAKTAFLSQDDVQIATQLKGIYGNDVPAALNSTYAAGIRVNNAFKGISSAIETNLTQGLTDIVSGAKSAGQAFSDMGKAIVTAIEQMIIKIAIVQPLMQALQNSIGGTGGLGSLLGLGGPSALPGTAGSPQFGPVAPNAMGGVYSGSGISAYSGQIVDQPTLFKFASGTGMMGEAGPEAIVPLKRGSDGSLGIASPGGGGSQVNVTVHNYGNDNVGVNSKQNANGGLDLELMVGQAAAKSAATPGAPLNRVMTDSLGARQRLASR